MNLSPPMDEKDNNSNDSAASFADADADADSDAIVLPIVADTAAAVARTTTLQEGTLCGREWEEEKGELDQDPRSPKKFNSIAQSDDAPASFVPDRAAGTLYTTMQLTDEEEAAQEHEALSYMKEAINFFDESGVSEKDCYLSD
jgi:hypothetical protein